MTAVPRRRPRTSAWPRTSPWPRPVAERGREAWEDGDCPWCRALLGPGLALAEPGIGHGSGRSRSRRADLPAWVHRARLVMVPMAALTVVAAVLVALA
ncbi:hypothetical protein ACWDSD_09835 [Streptomyces spiralis]